MAEIKKAVPKTRKHFWQLWRPTTQDLQTEPEDRTVLDVVQDYYDARTKALEDATAGRVVSHPRGKKVSLSTILTHLRKNVLQVYASFRRGGFEENDWDLVEVQNALQTESIFRRAVEKYVEQMWKNGFDFVGQNTQTVAYIRQRFAQIAQVTGRATLELFQEMGVSLVMFAQIQIIKQRNLAASGGRPYITFDGKKRKPIAGYTVADPSTMWVKKDSFGNVKRWKQYLRSSTAGSLLDAKAPEWPAHNVIHIQDRTATSPKYFFAMPMVIPVLADIKALRETEELALLQAIKFAIAKFHGKVGTDDKPGTQPEIDDLTSLLNSLPSDGVLVTTNRVSLENISGNDTHFDMQPLKAYWRARILAGLGMSDIAMGNGDSSSRATAQVLSTEMQSTTIKFQQILKTGVEEWMIKELLYEAGYRPETIKDNMVYLHIPEIDLEQKIKREAHALQKWQSNAITQDELRKELGKDVMTKQQEQQLYLYLVQIPLAEAEAKAKLLASSQNAVRNTNQPANQHGRSMAKPRISKDSFDDLRAQLTDSATIATKEQLLTALSNAQIDQALRDQIQQQFLFALASDEQHLLPVAYVARLILDTIAQSLVLE